MRLGLSTGPGAERVGSLLSVPIFSEPHDCADLVNSLQAIDTEMFFTGAAEHFDASGVRKNGPKSNEAKARKAL